MTRRGIIWGAALSTMLPVLGHASQAGPPDVGVYCEPTLAPAIGAVGLAFARGSQGAPVAVLTAPAALILLQVKQNPAEDLLILPASSMDKAFELEFIDSATRWDGLKNRLVIAARADAHVSLAGAGDLQALLGSGRVAATDPTPASTLDGVGLLGKLGLASLLSGRVMGVPDTANAAFLVKTGAARFGLMYATDVAANPDLAVAAALDPAIATPVMFAVALNIKPRSRNAHPFLDFLKSPEAAGELTHKGLDLA